ncbi:MAG: pyrroline-5-carboxylate reductase [Lachnospiraceae bacterium]|nr:pyrroline-5-carboxylate reductase [Lachnospiraceae bacterium]
MKIGFVGCGNMATAMIGGILKKGMVSRENLIASAKSPKTLDKIDKELGIRATADKRKIAVESDVLILAVKSVNMKEVIEEISIVIRPETIVVTLAPGKTLQWLNDTFGKPTKLVRTMPNTPALVGEGMTAMCPNDYVRPEEVVEIEEIFQSFGKTQVVPEPMIDVVVAVSGSSPAYVFLFIEALADAAVADGMSREQAYEFAAQSVLGSAKMLLETRKHPGVLKDMVCSPGGTTIEAVRVLEERGLRSAVFEATKACVKKAKEM